jgi:ribose-phosphate pyrophosphokinase
VYICQRALVPGSKHSVYDRFVALLHAVDAARCADADRVTVVLPYFPGGRQDKRKGHVREGVSTGLFARMLTTAGASMVITVEPHNEAMIGCFRPGDTVFEPVYLTGLLSRYIVANGLVADVVASTDVGGLEMARRFGERLKCGLVALSKERDYSRPSTVLESTVIGDPRGKTVLIIDDIVDTAGSMCSAVRSLWAEGATDIVIAAPHMLLTGPAWERLHVLKAEADGRGVGLRLIGTSAIQHRDPPDWYHTVAIEPLLADIIRRVNTRGSVRDLENTP